MGKPFFRLSGDDAMDIKKEKIAGIGSVPTLVGILGLMSFINAGSDATSSPNNCTSIKPMDGSVWAQEDGIRAAWLGHDVDEKILDNLVQSECNTLILSHHMFELLDLESARREGEKIIVDYDHSFADKLMSIADRAAKNGIRTFIMATYSLKRMLPTLKRLGYASALVEGPTRYLSAGPSADAAGLDPVFWRGITGAHGEIIAHLSREHPIAGILYDTEHYGGGIMYLNSVGFADVSFGGYLKEANISKTVHDIPPNNRYNFLKDRGLLHDFYLFLEEGAFDQGRYLAKRWHSINQNLMFGFWMLSDNWFARGFLRGLAGEVPSLGLAPCEYYHGSDSTQSMAEFFEERIPNMLYMPGFFPRLGYTAEQLEYHIAQSIRVTGRYWMLSPGSQLKDPKYREALRKAYQKGVGVTCDKERSPIDLRYRMQSNMCEPLLVVETVQKTERFCKAPLLTLRSVLGGATLCKNLPMNQVESGYYQVSIPLTRLLTNNLYMPNGFRSGISYEYEPVPNEFLYQDRYHSKLFDGRDYGFFGTTVAWAKDITDAEVVFDLHRPYKITKVAVSQPAKLEDRYGGPCRFTVDIGKKENEWEMSLPIRISGSDDVELSDKEREQCINHAWLGYVVDEINRKTRWLRIRMKLLRPNASISLGQVAIWGEFNGAVQVSLREGDKTLIIGKGKRFSIPLIAP
jgi:hypothetical protein